MSFLLLKKQPSFQDRLLRFMVKLHPGIDVYGKSLLFSISRAQSVHHLGATFYFDQVASELGYVGWSVLSSVEACC